MKTLNEDDWLVYGSQEYNERWRRIQEVAEGFNDLAEMPSRVTDQGDALYSKVAAISRAWASVLSDGDVAQGYARLPMRHEDYHWLTTQLLETLNDKRRNLREMMLNVAAYSFLGTAADELATDLRQAGLMNADRNYLGPIGAQDNSQVLQRAFNDYTLEEAERKRREEAIARDALNEIRANAEEGKQALAEGKQALDALKQSAGEYGDLQLEKYFRGLADSQTTTANAFRGWTITLIVLGALCALLFLLAPSDWFSAATDLDRVVRMVQKGIFVAGVFGLAAYLGRQSQHHRSQAHWADSLAVQLRTFDAFLAPVVNPEVRDDLRKTFGARAFGEHPAMKGEPQTESSTFEAAASLLAKILPGSKGPS
ncbi:hypothetical protein ACIPY3_03345 [Paenarthrobacter sp. NPDC089714]|uniref:hypothetical protein n=1 Tax=Paenarthrobacter sp. NPDC089714 TaxID=3364377 RepID=UPI003822DBDC